MKETAIRILMQWESNSNNPNDGENHLYRLVIHSEADVTIPHKIYLCGKEWSELPTTDVPPETLDNPELFCKECYRSYSKEFKR